MAAVSSEQLTAQLARRLAPLYLVHGEETLLVQEACDAVRAAARAGGCSERQVHTLDGPRPDWSHLLAEAQTQSLFAERRLLEVRIPGGKPGKEGGEALQRYVDRLNPDVVTLIQMPRLDRQQQQSAWFSALAEVGVVVKVEAVDRRALPAWIAQRLAAQGQRMVEGDEGAQALAFMADRVEGNLLAAHQEVQKLALLHPPGPLSLAQVQAAVLNVARYDVFKLGEAVWSGQVARALRMLAGLQAEGEGAVLVHWTLAEDVRSLARLQQAQAAGRPLAQALREQRVWGPKEALFADLLPRLEAARLGQLLRAASLCDGVIKGLKAEGWPADPWDALRQWVLQLLQVAAAERGPELRRGGRANAAARPRLALEADAEG